MSVIYVTSITQPWKRIRAHAARLSRKMGSGQARVVCIPPNLTPREQVAWTEVYMLTAPEWDGPGFLIVASTYELPILRALRQVRESGETGQSDNICARFSARCVRAGLDAAELRVDSSGEFRDVWPDGFFDERMRELF